MLREKIKAEQLEMMEGEDVDVDNIMKNISDDERDGRLPCCGNKEVPRIKLCLSRLWFGTTADTASGSSGGRGAAGWKRERVWYVH